MYKVKNTSNNRLRFIDRNTGKTIYLNPNEEHETIKKPMVFYGLEVTELNEPKLEEKEENRVVRNETNKNKKGDN